MGDLSVDTRSVPLGNGVYRATLSKDWEAWGPLGGYVASLALRAVAAESEFTRPVSFSCHYLSAANFDDADIAVTTIRSGRSAAAHDVTITQGDRKILVARAWSCNSGEGPSHNHASPLQVSTPGELDPIPDRRRASWPFSQNFRYGNASEPGTVPPGASWRVWAEFQPVARYDDPWLDACRSVVLLDVSSFMAASAAHGGIDIPYVAPTLDIHVTFHGLATASEWLLVDTHSPVSRDGLFGWRGNTWTTDGALVATAIGQSVWRKL